MSQSPLRRRITPSVPFHLKVEDADGGSFTLSFKVSYDFNAMALVEEVTGMSMITGDVFDNPSCSNISALLWAGIQENHPDYAGQKGLQAIRSCLNIATATEALKAINEAFLLALPKEQADLIRQRAQEKAAGKSGEASSPLVTPGTVQS